MTRRFKLALVLLLGVYLLGGVGYKWLSPQSSWQDCLFMSVITVATVGFGEIIDPAGHPAMRNYTMTLILVGVIVQLYAVSIVTAFFVEGDFTHAFWKRRMQRRSRAMIEHYIVCGGGEVGQRVAAELLDTNCAFVVIEQDPGLVEQLRKLGEITTLQGRADDEEVLERAGVRRAVGAIVVLPRDRDNLVTTLAIRTLSPSIRIVSKQEEPGMAKRLKQAGADAVVNTAAIGGLRLVSEMIRPSVVSFLDDMLRDPNHAYRFEELRIASTSEWAHRRLVDIPLRSDFNLLLAAVKRPNQDESTYNPDDSWQVEPGQILIVLGNVRDVNRARRVAQSV